MKNIIKNVMPYGLVKKYSDKKTKKILNAEYERIEQRDLYNSHGEKINIFYLKDNLSIHQPWGFVYGRTPQKILWDRVHPGLDIHFYTHEKILDVSGNPKKKFAYFIETEKIVPEDYKIFSKNPGLENEFDAIFTHSEALLNRFTNARYLPPSGVWYANEFSDNILDEKQYEKKDKLVSIIASNKQMCEMHKLRSAVAWELKKNNLGDTYGTFDGGKWIIVDETLKNYKFQIVIENEISAYYFTEKILNCFASMTIPVYIGATKIGDFFNEDGIIFVKEPTVECVMKTMKQCSEKYYEEHIEAVKDNYQRVQEFLCIEDFLINRYENILK